MGKTILIIDDSESVRQLLAFSLKENGYEVIEADNGKTALSRLSGAKIHLIICDVNMPEMDGIAFVKALKNDEAYAAYKFTPVIMLTTESGEDKKAEGKDAGVKAWMVKPFTPDRLLSAVQKLMA
ncbi:MAG: response regulator [Spirochaetota bacterium]|jgi:two-component system chemotaxis response regulator CheY